MKSYILHLENFLKVEQATVELKPGLIGLVGKNAQGKTTILNALSDLLQGKNDFTKIRDGAERAVVRIDVMEDGELLSTVSRTQTKETMKMDAKGLRPGQTAAGLLATMFDEIAINPVKLATTDPVAYLKKHLPAQIEKGDIPEEMQAMINELSLFQGKETVVKETGFALAEKLAEDVAANRVVTGKKVQQEEAVVADIKKGLPAEQPAIPYDEAQVKAEVESLQVELNDAGAAMERHKAAKHSVEVFSKKIEMFKKEIEAVRKEREGLLAQAERLAERITTLERNAQEMNAGDLTQASDALARAPAPVVEEIQQRMNEATRKLKEIESVKLVQQGFKTLFQREAVVKALKDAYEKQDKVAKFFKYELPKRLIQKCKLPVEGIEFVDGAMHVDGRPLDKLSTAERAIITTKLAMAIAKQKGHIAIALDGVEYLDAEHRAEFLKAANDSGMCVIYTRMGTPEYEHEKLVENGRIVQ